MHQLKSINLEDVSTEESSTFRVRDTVRAVIFDDQNKIALMWVTKDSFHKLPGGGIDDAEDALTALRRECREEVGVEIDELVELGLVTEIKRKDATVQNSYCYIARIIGGKGAPQLTESEKERGYEILWVDLDEAIRLIERDRYSDLVGQSIMERELVIMAAANAYVNKL